MTTRVLNVTVFECRPLWTRIRWKARPYCKGWTAQLIVLQLSQKLWPVSPDTVKNCRYTRLLNSCHFRLQTLQNRHIVDSNMKNSSFRNITWAHNASLMITMLKMWLVNSWQKWVPYFSSPDHCPDVEAVLVVNLEAQNSREICREMWTFHCRRKWPRKRGGR